MHNTPPAELTLSQLAVALHERPFNTDLLRVLCERAGFVQELDSEHDDLAVARKAAEVLGINYSPPHVGWKWEDEDFSEYS